jgi:hypothetical protein
MFKFGYGFSVIRRNWGMLKKEDTNVKAESNAT